MIKLYSKNNPSERIDEIVHILCDGGIAIIPTESTYVLACHAMKERAVERICKIRNINPSEHPLSVICYDMSAISEYALISTPIYKVMKRNLPGPFTFILQGKNKLPKIFKSKKTGEIGIRMPESPILNDILHELDASPYDDEAYHTNPELIEETFGSQVDIVVDGGMGKMGQSTIIDCHDDKFEIIRQGDGILI